MGMVVVAFLAANAGVRLGHDQINLKANQIPRELGQPFGLLLGKPVFDGEMLTLNPTKLAHLLLERVDEDRANGSSARVQEPYWVSSWSRSGRKIFPGSSCDHNDIEETDQSADSSGKPIDLSPAYRYSVAMFCHSG